MPRTDPGVPLVFGREVCGRWDDAIEREWLVTNGIGGFGCGTIAGANTRRYHGFLIANLKPPQGRKLLVAKVDVTVTYLGKRYPLFANEFQGGVVDPSGFVHIESFAVQNGVPVWRYAFADVLLEQTIFMAPGANTSYLRFEVLRGNAPLVLELTPLVSYRDYHSHSRGARPFRAIPRADATTGCTVQAFAGAPAFHLASSAGNYTPTDTWYWNFWHRAEFERGLDALEDLWVPGFFSTELRAGQALVFTASSEDVVPQTATEVLARVVGRSQRLIAALPDTAPPWIRTLATASEQFIMQRGSGEQSTSVIAGYPWFTDWGRDTMIALPGLTTALGRFDTTAAILRTYASFVDGGMLPNRFSAAGEPLEYNTADATLWMFQALREHLAVKSDPTLVQDLYPTLTRIVHAHVDGTRYGIKVDAHDGLLMAGAADTQLTWMDAKHGDRVFTPRCGKPVEINALWLNALDVMVSIASGLHDAAETRFCQTLLNTASAGFSRFWNEAQTCLYDVIDVGGAAHDASIRPNQIFAVSLPYCVLTAERMRAVVDRCGRELLTSYGLRSLSAADPAYVRHYLGDAWQRDAAYHQGTVWAWLLGPFARAHHRVYGDAALAQAFLAPIAQHLANACVGSVSEIFDGDAPHTARGCFAQAWSVAEILRCWLYLDAKTSDI